MGAVLAPPKPADAPKAKLASKPKALKKLPPTITEKATRPYQENRSQEATILQYMSPEKQCDDQNPTSDTRGKTTRPIKTKSKGSSTGGSGNLKILQRPESPESAVTAMVNQDFAFGTSSQLAQGTSAVECPHPTFLNPLSEIAEGTSQRSTGADIILRFQGTRTLWSAAARDNNGTLVETINLTFPEPTADDPGPEEVLIDTRKISFDMLKETGFVDIDDIKGFDDVLARGSPESHSGPTEIASSKRPAPQMVQHSTTEAALRKRSKKDLSSKKAQSNQTSIKRRTTDQKGQQLCGDHSDSMPDFTKYPKADLRYALNSLGFKPSSRETMIETLQDCWKSKRRLVLQSVDPNAQLPQRDNELPLTVMDLLTKKIPNEESDVTENGSAAHELDGAGPQRRKRGRPRKEPTADEDLTPKARKKRAPKVDESSISKKQKKSKAAKESTTDQLAATRPTNAKRDAVTAESYSNIKASSNAKSSANTPLADDQAAVLAKITEAIMTEPPTHDAANPSWHERMLMYEPIVLEDLAAWLNTSGLGRVGCDVEVGLGELSTWCRARSVCCVGRLNLRGRERTRL